MNDNEKIRYKGVIFVANVVNNVGDPKNAGQVQIRIPSLFDGVPDNKLPWAASRNNPNSFIVPAIGEDIYVTFEDESPYHPYYWADVKKTGSMSDSPFGDELPYAWGFYDGTNYLKFNYDNGVITLLAGSTIQINSDVSVGDKNLTSLSTTGNITSGTGAFGTFVALSGEVITVQGGIITNIF